MGFRSSLRIVAASALLFSGGAGAVTMSQGDSATIGWSGTYGGANLSASVVFSLTSLSGTDAYFSVSVANNTLASEPGTNRFVSFGITDIDPNISGAMVTNNGDWIATRDTNFPGGFQTIELCIWGGSECSGGAGGLAEGESDSFILRLTGVFAGTITLGEPFPSKWQSVGPDSSRSFQFGGACVQGCDGSSVPEPGPLALFGLGIAGLVLRKRRHAR